MGTLLLLLCAWVVAVVMFLAFVLLLLWLALRHHGRGSSAEDDYGYEEYPEPPAWNPIGELLDGVEDMFDIFNH